MQGMVCPIKFARCLSLSLQGLSVNFQTERTVYALSGKTLENAPQQICFAVLFRHVSISGCSVIFAYVVINMTFLYFFVVLCLGNLLR